MTELEILERWEKDKPLYKAWAELIAQTVESQLVPAIAPTLLEYFLKVPVVPRLKGDTSLVDKALYRKKGYADPYGDITDKVGIRYVVLLTSDIRRLGAVIESGPSQAVWTFSRDKDFEDERLAKPFEFTYQSVHYVLKSKPGHSFSGVNIPEGIACEVQIRTLLQHAHSELTHDTLYKPRTTAKPSVKRTVAKSMALIEATDEFFEKAMAELVREDAPQRLLLEHLSGAYQNGVGRPAGRERSNELLLDAFVDLLPEDVLAKIDKLLEDKPYIFDRIKDRGSRHFFKQPTVLMAYFLAETMPARAKEVWPLDFADLEHVFSDLGKKYDI